MCSVHSNQSITECIWTSSGKWSPVLRYPGLKMKETTKNFTLDIRTRSGSCWDVGAEVQAGAPSLHNLNYTKSIEKSRRLNPLIFGQIAMKSDESRCGRRRRSSHHLLPTSYFYYLIFTTAALLSSHKDYRVGLDEIIYIGFRWNFRFIELFDCLKNMSQIGVIYYY